MRQVARDLCSVPGETLLLDQIPSTANVPSSGHGSVELLIDLPLPCLQRGGQPAQGHHQTHARRTSRNRRNVLTENHFPTITVNKPTLPVFERSPAALP
jgi:hypothetical protein